MDTGGRTGDAEEEKENRERGKITEWTQKHMTKYNAESTLPKNK